MYVESKPEIVKSILNFMESPKYHRKATASAPKYFLHFQKGTHHYFGLSKFCVFKDIALLDYIKEIRFQTGGGDAQKRIARITRQKWTPISKIDYVVRKEFQEWFFDFFPKDYNLDRISLISLKLQKGVRASTNKPKTNQVSPDELVRKLKRQEQIGKAGEDVAYLHEVGRLRTLNIRDPEKWIDRVSFRNAAAGFDILTEVPRRDLRYIEVKSTTGTADSIYITRNEVDTLEVHGEDAYLYIVRVSNLKRKEGHVIQEIRNPIKYLKSMTSFEPVLYNVKLSD